MEMQTPFPPKKQASTSISSSPRFSSCHLTQQISTRAGTLSDCLLQFCRGPFLELNLQDLALELPSANAIKVNSIDVCSVMCRDVG